MRIRIGSFNVHRLGKSDSSKERFKDICDIIRNEGMDIVSFQEIYSEGRALDIQSAKMLLNT